MVQWSLLGLISAMISGLFQSATKGKSYVTGSVPIASKVCSRQSMGVTSNPAEDAARLKALHIYATILSLRALNGARPIGALFGRTLKDKMPLIGAIEQAARLQGG